MKKSLAFALVSALFSASAFAADSGAYIGPESKGSGIKGVSIAIKFH